jgi:hypothetical protein
LPTHTHAAGTYAVATTITNGTNVIRNSGNDIEVSAGSGQFAFDDNYTKSTISLASGTVTGASGNNTTTATDLTITQPYKLGTWYIKL